MKLLDRETTERRARLDAMQDGLVPQPPIAVKKSITLHQNQLVVMASQAGLILASGGWGAGKTYVGAVWALQRICKCPECLGLIIANTYSQLAKSTLKPLCELMDSIGVAWSYGVKPRGWTANQVFPPNGWSNILSIGNGCCIMCQSADHFEPMAGMNLGWCWMDECQDTSFECFKLGQSRLRDKTGPMDTLITTTPPLAGRSHWLYPLFFGEAGEKLPNSETYTLRTRDNPELPADYADKIFAMGATQAQACLEGLWINALANACFEFDRVKHVSNCSLDPHLPLILSADQNVQPYTGVVMQLNKQKREVKVLDEIYISDFGSTRKCAEMFISRFAAWDGDVQFYCDSSSVHRDTRESPNDMEIMRQVLKTKYPSARDASDHRVRRVFDGVIAVNALLNPLQGAPRITISPKCKNLIRDMEGLRWGPDNKIDKKSNPLLSHCADALRYPIAQNLPVMGQSVSGLDRWPGEAD